jgi:hypothetical protein
MAQSILCHRFDHAPGAAEMGIYSVLAGLLSATILAAIASACKLLFDSIIHWTVATQTLRVRNELLIVLMLAEILHTVRISIRSHVLVTEPFLSRRFHRLDSAHPGNQPGNGHPRQRGGRDERQLDWFPQFDD